MPQVRSDRMRRNLHYILVLVFVASLAIQLALGGPQDVKDSPQNANMFTSVKPKDATSTLCAKFTKNSPGCKRICQCDPIGSKAASCDKISGTCSCRLGYSGSSCNLCSLGYYDHFDEQAHTSNSNVSNLVEPERRCVECGDCFNGWHRVIATLKDRSVDIIKQTNDLGHKLSSSFQLTTTGHGTSSADDSIPGGVVQFDDLNSKIGTIGQRLLQNKLNSDKINLFAYELNETLHDLNETQMDLIDQLSRSELIKADTSRLVYKVRLQGEILDGFENLLRESFIQHQIQIQQFIPEGAYRIVSNQLNRSRSALESVNGFENYFHNNFDYIIHRLSGELSSTLLHKHQLDIIGLRILSSLLDLYSINVTTSNLCCLYQPVPLVGNGMAYENLVESVRNDPNSMIEVTKFITEQAAQVLGVNQSDVKNGTTRISPANLSTNESKQSVDNTNYTLAVLDSLIVLMGQFDHLIARPSIVQMIENSTRITRTYLERVEDIWTTGRAEFDELYRLNYSLGPPINLITNISAEVRQIFDRNQLELEHYDNGLKTFLDCKSNLKELEVTSTHSKETFNQILEMQEQTRSNLSQFMTINSTLGMEIFKLNCSIDELEHDLFSLINDSITTRTTGHDMRLFTLVFFDRHKQLETKLMEHRITSESLIRKATKDIVKDNLEKTELLVQVEGSLQEMGIYLDVLNKDSKAVSFSSSSLIDNLSSSFSQREPSRNTSTGNNPTDLIKRNAVKLRDRRRAAELILELKQVSTYLYKLVGKVSNLSLELEENEMTLNKQLDVIDQLDLEMTSVNGDIQEKLAFHERNDCPKLSQD